MFARDGDIFPWSCVCSKEMDMTSFEEGSQMMPYQLQWFVEVVQFDKAFNGSFVIEDLKDSRAFSWMFDVGIEMDGEGIMHIRIRNRM